MTEKHTNSKGPDYFVMIPRMARQDLSNGAFKLYAVLKEFAGETGACWASQAKLADMMGEHSGQHAGVNNLRRWREELEEKGYIVVRDNSTPEKGPQPYHIEITNVWKENSSRFDADLRSEWLAEHPDKALSWLMTYHSKCRDLKPEELAMIEKALSLPANEGGSKMDRGGWIQNGSRGGSEMDPGVDPKRITKNIDLKNNQEEERSVAHGCAGAQPRKTRVGQGALDAVPNGVAPILDEDSRKGEKKQTPSGEQPLHALEIWIKKTIPHRTLSRTYREKLRQPVTFLPDGARETVTAPSPIDMWDQSPEWADFLAQKPEYLAKNGGLNMKSLVYIICAPSTYEYFHKRYGIPGLDGKAAAAPVQGRVIDGVPLDEREQGLWKSLTEVFGYPQAMAEDYIREHREKYGKKGMSDGTPVQD